MMTNSSYKSQEIENENVNTRSLTGIWFWIIVGVSIIALLVIINHIFQLGLFGISMLDTSYLYLILALYCSVIFLIYPMKTGNKEKRGLLFGVDVLLGIFLLAGGVLFSIKGHDILYNGWMALSPPFYTILGILYVLVILEALRRAQNITLFIVVALFAVLPMFAEFMPLFLRGIGFNFVDTFNYHIFSAESVLGIPMRVFGDLLVGYMLFGVVLIQTGGSSFFMDLSNALLGHSRGGPAKVSVIASALMGSISGSVVSNVVTTGAVTIPAMKRAGYPNHVAAAVEACSSTGGVLMPPVMGATAFIMAMFLSTSYLNVIIAASVPSFLYYLGILVQVDAYAARVGLKGISREELPSIATTLRDGWFYIVAIILLIVFLLFRLEAQAPFYASGFLLVFASLTGKMRFDLHNIKELLFNNIKLLSEMVVLFASIGLIVGSLSMTGIAHALSGEMVRLAHGNVIFLVMLGAVTSIILGMGMTITACYIFLAITLAPALISSGLNPMAVHLFIMYCGVLSYLTPPVCIGVYPAAALAGADSMKTALRALGLGIVSFIVPFFFVANPALILEGHPWEVIHTVVTAVIGVILLASAIEGYLIGMGDLFFKSRTRTVENALLRICVFASGVFMMIPVAKVTLVGICLGTAIIFLLWKHKKTGVK